MSYLGNFIYITCSFQQFRQDDYLCGVRQISTLVNFDIRERLDDSTPISDDSLGLQLPSVSLLPHAIDDPHDVEHLLPHRGVGLVSVPLLRAAA